MTEADLMVLAPWLVFGAVLAVIGYRLLTHRRTSRQAAPPGRRGRTGEPPDDNRNHAPATRPTGRDATTRNQGDAGPAEVSRK